MAYVYRHIRLDKNLPFYIGIGTDQNYSRAHQKTFRNKHWSNVAAKTDIEVEILFDGISIDFAKKKEREFISLYKRAADGGILTNITLGGEGVLGLKNPKLSERNKSGLWKGKKHSQESKNRIGEKHKGKTISEEHRRAVSMHKYSSGAWRGTKNPRYRGEIYLLKGEELVAKFEYLQDLADYLQITLSKAFRFLKGLPTPSISAEYKATRIFKGKVL